MFSIQIDQTNKKSYAEVLKRKDKNDKTLTKKDIQMGDDVMRKKQDKEIKEIRFEFGNPSVEIIEGELHLFRDKKVENTTNLPVRKIYCMTDAKLHL